MKEFTSHRIAGGFHWELKLNSLAYGTNKTRIHFKPNTTRVLIDTGSTISYLIPADFT